jgi:hypothetical protein
LRSSTAAAEVIKRAARRHDLAPDEWSRESGRTEARRLFRPLHGPGGSLERLSRRYPSQEITAMQRTTRLLVPAMLVSILAASPTLAVTSGTATVSLAATANTMIQILDPSITLSPTSTDYDNDMVEAAGASGLRVRVKTNSATGMILSVRCSDASPQIALADLLVRATTPPGSGGSALGSYTAISASNMTLWSTGVAQHPWQTVTTDVRVQNLFGYDDGAGPGVTNYTNTLTYTVITQ